MASRVNTRFVIILVVGVIALLGMVVAAYSVAFKSAADNIREGERLLAEGNVKQAERAFSKAVNKDTTNAEYLDKWIESLEMLVPETETEYRDRFNKDLTGAIAKKATVLRNDMDAHDRQLSMLHAQLLGGYSRGIADRLIEQSTLVLGFFRDDLSGNIQPWERLKRYRGIAISKIAINKGILDDDKIDLGIDDLERVTTLDPTDTESLSALLDLQYAQVDRAASQDRMDLRIEALRANLERANAYLESHPNSIVMRLQVVRYKADIASRSINRSLTPAQQLEFIKGEFSKFHPELDEIVQLINSSGVTGDLDLRYLITFAGIENAVDPVGRFSRSRRILDLLIEHDRDDAEVLYYAGQLAERAGDDEEALAWYKQIESLQTKPLSYAGLRQYFFQRQAIANRCGLKLNAYEAAETDEARASALTEAKALRDQFNDQVGDDNTTRIMLNGRIAIAEKQYDEALRIFTRYNNLVQNADPEGLWYEGIVAAQLSQFGTARNAFEALITFETHSRRIPGMLALAQILDQLQELEQAAELYARVLEMRPDMEVAIEANDRLQRRLNPELNDDPELAAIYTSRQIRTGTKDQPGDYAGAIEYLREQVVALEYAPLVSRELASLLLDRGDIDGSRALITKAVEMNEGDESLERLLSAMDAGDTTQILIQLLRDSPGPLLDRLISIANIASSRGLVDLLADTVREMNEIAPDDKRVLELTFVDALRRNDFARAKAIASHSANTRVESLAYQARIAITENQIDRALDLLKQATATGAADASVFQMLGVIQRDAGQTNDAIASFTQALTIRPDNGDIIREFILTLTLAGRYEQALDEARKYQRYASGDPVFINLWLSLEAQFGAQQGREFATRQRERMLELNPRDLDNTFQLARLYILSRNWNPARTLIDSLRAQNDQLAYVELDATWYAEQGIVNGREGLTQANEVFAAYIDSLPEPVSAEPFVANSQFMLSRGRPDLALVAANEAVARQDPATMQGSILLGDLYMRINNHSEAAKAYQTVVDAGVDNEDHTVRARYIETLVRLERYEEAQQAYNGFPSTKRSDMLIMLQGADIASGLEDNALAQQLLNNAVAAFPNNPLVYIKRAELMIGDESLRSDMLSDLNRALELDPSSWRAHSVRAAGYFALNQREDALNDLIQAIRLNPSLDRSINSVLNELLALGRVAQAESIAREVIMQRPDDAILMSRIAGIFGSREEWKSASIFFEMAWDKRRSPTDGASLIDTLVRQTPPNTDKANAIINQLAAIVGDIDQNSGLLAAQALVLQARGREDFALQQITKSFDISVTDNVQLLNWANNLDRFFDGRSASEHVGYLETLKRRNTNAVIGQWLDFFIAQRLMREDTIPQRAFDMIATLQSSSTPDLIAARAYRVHGTTLFAQDDFQGAFETWNAGLERFPDDWEMNNNVAYTLGVKLGKPENALAYGEKAISQNIQLSEPYETMASIYIALNKFDEAEQMIQTGRKFINSIPASVTMNLTAGRLAMKRGDLVDARSKITDSRSLLRSAPESYPILQADIDEFEAELNSAGN
jgi:tetratricopeptide (TPR) repeat protein